MGILRRLLKGVLLLALPLGAANQEVLVDAPYVVLTGYSRYELEELSYLSEAELERRIGLAQVPGGLSGARGARGRSAHAIASYLGTRRWGPNVTIALGYLREYVPALFLQREADPGGHRRQLRGCGLRSGGARAWPLVPAQSSAARSSE